VVTRWTYLGLVLLAVGLVGAGAGAAGHVDGQQCRSTQHVVVAPVENATAPAPYEELSDAEQSVFRQALESPGGLLTQRGAIDEGAVRYENETYDVQVARGDDCAPYDTWRVTVPFVGGLALVGVGLALTRGCGG
jgi:hypothetical protein